MISKKLLLAGIAAGALAAAGSANAIVLTASATNAMGPFTTNAPYSLSRELNYSGGIISNAGDFSSNYTFNTALAPGTYTLTITFAGATINQGLSTSPVVSGTSAAGGTSNSPIVLTDATANGATATLTSGGTAGSTTATYTIQVTGGTVTNFNFAPALNVASAVSETVSVFTPGATSPADPTAQATIITTTAVGFLANVRIGSALGSNTPTAPTQISQDGGKFDVLATGMGNDAIIGYISAEIASAPGNLGTGSPVAYRDLAGNTVMASDVSALSATITGDFSRLDVSAGAGTSLTSKAVNAETFSVPLPAGYTSGQGIPISLVTNSTSNGLIPPSVYAGNVTGTLTSTRYNNTVATLSGSGPLETVNLVGAFSYVIPWVNSATQAATSGNTTVIRVSNLSTTLGNGNNSKTAALFGILYNATLGAPNVTNTATNLGSLGLANTGNREAIITSTTLQNAFGNFGRGDLRLVIADSTQTGNTTPMQNGYVVKRLFSGANGGLTEMSILSGDPGTEPNTGATVVQQ